MELDGRKTGMERYGAEWSKTEDGMERDGSLS
jgi:hypothetical protein